jgi:Skp family chaperone for outer membrane proteins
MWVKDDEAQLRKFMEALSAGSIAKPKTTVAFMELYISKTWDGTWKKYNTTLDSLFATYENLQQKAVADDNAQTKAAAKRQKAAAKAAKEAAKKAAKQQKSKAKQTEGNGKKRKAEVDCAAENKKKTKGEGQMVASDLDLGSAQAHLLLSACTSCYPPLSLGEH